MSEIDKWLEENKNDRNAMTAYQVMRMVVSKIQLLEDLRKAAKP